MIQVHYIRAPDDLEMVINGHAEAGVKGHDLVCAEASILSQTLEAIVRAKAENPFVYKQPGIMVLYVGDQPQLQKYFDFAFVGLDILAENEPEHVQCKIVGRHPMKI